MILLVILGFSIKELICDKGDFTSYFQHIALPTSPKSCGILEICGEVGINLLSYNFVQVWFE